MLRSRKEKQQGMEVVIPWVYPEFCVNVLRECKQQKLV